MRYILCVLVCLTVPGRAVSGEWETHVNSNVVTSIIAGDDLVHWGSAGGGVVVRDPGTGSDFKIVKEPGGLPSNEVTVLARDGAGNLWAGTASDGVGVLDDAGTWTYHATDNLHLLSDRVLDIEHYGNRTMVGTAGGVSLFVDGEFLRFFNGEDWGVAECDSAIAVTLSEDRALVGTECGLFEYDLDTGAWDSHLAGRRPHNLAYDGSDMFWVITSDAEETDSIFTYDGSSFIQRSKRFLAGYSINEVQAVDSLVMIASNNGPVLYDFADDLWLQQRLDLPSRIWNVSSMAVLDDSTMWIGTRDGIGRLAGESWEIHETFGPEGNYAQDIEIDPLGSVWVATGSRGGVVGDAVRGAFKYDGSEWTRFSDELPSGNVYSLAADFADTTLWVGFWIKGLMRHDLVHGGWTDYSDSLRSTVVSDLFIDDEGRLVVGEYRFGGWGGIGVRCGDGRFIHYSNEDEEVCVRTECVTAIGAGPAGGLMLGSYISPSEECYAEVVNLRLGGACGDKSDDQCTVWSSFDDWAQGFAYGFARDPYGVVWLATSGGLSAYDGEWHTVTAQIGSVWDVVVDSSGTKWVASDDGLMSLRGFGVEWADFAGRVEVYDSGNSPLPEAPVKALDIGADGALWIGTGGGGFYRFEPEAAEAATENWVDAYPNPFIDTKHEEIKFTGFLPGSQIRIYTLAGELVAEIESDSAWTGEKMEEMDVVSGIYLYHAYAEDGSEFIGKLAVVR
jgi:ligand-binding sensor domain-containing protein